MKRHKITIWLSLVLVGFLWGTTLTSMKVFAAQSLENKIEIESVDYTIDNIHPRCWQGDFDPNTPRLYITFYIYIKNLENCIDNIKEVEVYDSLNHPWTIDLKRNTNDSMRYIGGSRCFDEVLSNTGSVLCLNNYRVVITTKQNETISESFLVCEPGQKEGSTKKYLYNEDYRGQKNDSYIDALRWGKITSATFQNGNFDVQFTVNDGRTFNARLEFYDKNKNYLGATRWFINPVSKEIFESLNNGNRFNTDGQINNVQVENQEIYVQKSKNINKAKFIVLVTQDGNQFADSQNPYNFTHESLSEPFEVKK